MEPDYLKKFQQEVTKLIEEIFKENIWPGIEKIDKYLLEFAKEHKGQVPIDTIIRIRASLIMEVLRVLIIEHREQENELCIKFLERINSGSGGTKNDGDGNSDK